MGRKPSEKRANLEKYFEFKTNDGAYACTLCSHILRGVVKANFVSNTEDHLLRNHPNEYRKLNETSEKQQVINFNASSAISLKKKQRQDLVISFARTSLPMNIFRSESNRKFLKNVQSLSEIPDRKTVEKEMKDIVTTKLSTLSRAADFYGIQLDHWTNRHKLNVLVILASYIDSKWAFGLQVIDFKLVPNTTGIITAEEVIESLSQVGLNPQNCISYQSDNCSSMIKSARDFRRLTDMEINEEAEDSDEDTFSAAPNEEIDPFRRLRCSQVE